MITGNNNLAALRQMESIDLAPTRLRRDHIIPEEYRSDDVEQKYDRTTLWYDAIWANGVVQLICPPLWGLEEVLTRRCLFLDGQKVTKFRRRRFKYFEIISIKSPTPPSRVEVHVDDSILSSGVNVAEFDLFRGLNTIVVKSKNNELQWIKDFAVFHRKTQGAQGILFFDNGSDAYSLADLQHVLSTTGLQAVVVDAPFRFGPDVKDAGSAYRTRGQFFQHAILNIAKLRFLLQARAVTSLDVDELVWSEGDSIFDKAVSSWLGYVSFRGFWRYPPPDATPPLRHADHVWGKVKSSKTGRLPPGIRKYAVVPGRPFGKLVWSVHRVGPPKSEDLFERRDCGFWHCSGISTGWRYTSRLYDSGGSFMDEEARIIGSVME